MASVLLNAGLYAGMHRNPIWASLADRHAHLRQGDDTVGAYPADVTPFAAVAANGVEMSRAGLRAACAGAEAFYFIDAIPAVPPELQVISPGAVLQMACARASGLASKPVVPWRELGVGDAEAMVELTARVFPGFFRRRTPLMGRYIGAFADGRLVAMGGERFMTRDWCELSGICTDAAFLGRGYARTIVAVLAQRLLDEGVEPILHVDVGNVRAQAVYKSCGFTVSGELPVLKVRRCE